MRNCSGLIGHLLIGLFAMLVAQETPAQPAADSAQASPGNPSQRPRIGLVLAGGGAKGAAHVGVLKVLEELHVPIDCIAGTSMGALVGAGYSSGIPAPEMQTFLEGIDWQSVVGGLGQRGLQPIEQKRQGVTYSNTMELGIQDSQLVMPPGLVNTSGIEDLFRGFVAKSRALSDFDRFPIPYRAVATDMVTGKMVVLEQGDLATAMRASMAIPGAFAPVLMDGQVLADGGLVRNIPVDVARELCADVVIVVNLVEPSVQPERLRSPTQMLLRTMDVMIEANETLQLQSLTAQDIRIDVEMGDIGTADFERVPETIPLGEMAARRAAPQLQRFALPEAQYAAWRNGLTSTDAIESRIAEVRIAGLNRMNPDYLRQQMQLRTGDVVDISAISQESQRLSALADLEAVSYSLKGDPASPILEWLPQEKSWGPDYLKADIGLHASAGGDDSYLFYVQHRRTWVNNLGAQWRNELQLGVDQLLTTSFYQPLEVAQNFFVEPQLFAKRSREDVYLDGNRFARYQFDDAGARIDFGVNLGRQTQLRIGYTASQRKVLLDTGPQLLPESDSSDTGVVVSGIHDSRDTAFNPTRGLVTALEYIRSDDEFGGDRSWERAEVGVGVAVPFRQDVLWLNAAGGSDFGGGLPPDRLFVLGGPLSFPGHDVSELRAGAYWTLSGSYLWRLKDLFTLRGQALYGGLRLQGGRLYDSIDDVSGEEIGSASIYFTGRTPAGPLTLGVATTTSDSWSLWLSLGRPIGSGSILERGIFR